jgi:hypothetical protein
LDDSGACPGLIKRHRGSRRRGVDGNFTDAGDLGQFFPDGGMIEGPEKPLDVECLGSHCHLPVSMWPARGQAALCGRSEKELFI